MKKILVIGALVLVSVLVISLVSAGWFGGVTGNVIWSRNHCSDKSRCPAGEGDCDRDSHCLTGYCRHNVGRNYGQKNRWIDVCECQQGKEWNSQTNSCENPIHKDCKRLVDEITNFINTNGAATSCDSPAYKNIYDINSDKMISPQDVLAVASYWNQNKDGSWCSNQLVSTVDPCNSSSSGGGSGGGGGSGSSGGVKANSCDADSVCEVAKTISSKGTSDLILTSAANDVIVKDVNFLITNLSGSGNAYACIDSNGQIFRSQTPCI